MINGFPRILIVRLSSIGDVVRTLPALHSIRHAYPKARVDWVVERKSLDIVEGHPELDYVIIVDRREGVWGSVKSFLASCKEIRQNDYDIVLDFHGLLKSGLITRLSNAPDRFGFARPRSREFNSLALTNRLKLESQSINRTQENLLLCCKLPGVKPVNESLISVPNDIQDQIDDYFHRMFDGGKRVVVLHAPVERPEKQWPIEHFAALTDLLMADGRFEVMLTWGPKQFEIVQSVIKLTRGNPTIAPQTDTLKHYAWLANCADLYVGGDTGPMHIAAAMGTPVVAIFGGTDPEKHAPYQQATEILSVYDKTIPRRTIQRTDIYRERLETIEPETVYDACVRIIGAETL